MADGPAYLAGPESLRAGRERLALVLCCLATPLSLYVAFELTGVGASQLGLLVVGALVFVSFARGRLLGGSVRLGEGQLPEIHRTTEDLAARLGIETPHVFVRDDTFLALSAVGTGEPYSLILSSQYLEHLAPAELRYLIARELGHIAAGHTRLTSLLSASGRENPIVALVFGAWLRRTEFTADRIGLALAPGVDDAMRAIAISTFHAVGRRVDLVRLVDQQHDLDAEPALRLGEWSSSTPYATSRFLALSAFAEAPVFETWRDRFSRGDATFADAAPEEIARPGEPVGRRNCAPIFSRLIAIGIDAVVASAIEDPIRGRASRAPVPAGTANDPAFLQWIFAHAGAVSAAIDAGLFFTVFFAYSAILVVLLGQTLGMMVMDLRVVTTDYRRPGIVRTLWRYVAGFATLTIGWALAGFVLRIHPHDWLSRTRVVSRSRRRP